MLEPPDLLRLQPNVGQAPEAGGHAVDGLSCRDLLLHDGQRGPHATSGVGRQLGRRSLGDGDHVLDREPLADPDRHGTGRLRLDQSGDNLMKGRPGK